LSGLSGLSGFSGFSVFSVFWGFSALAGFSDLTADAFAAGADFTSTIVEENAGVKAKQTPKGGKETRR
jgi:hypothetical protein